MSTLVVDGRSASAVHVPNCRRVLKSRENIFKPKCNKALKNKLKKYKLRKDGQEDPDIIDVSKTLISSLRIKSPNNQNGCTKVCEYNKSHNYLTKMVRQKKTAAVVDSISTSSQRRDNDMNESISTIPKCDQDKKQTDAFRILMDSRNKSIGSNSPGKEKCEEESEIEKCEVEKLEKKELKAKRILSLSKMAQAKGSLKKIEIEEYHEEIIKRKMDERAKRLKRIVVGVAKNKGKKLASKLSIEKLVEKSVSPSKELDIDKTPGTLNDKTPVLKTIDLFKDFSETPTNNVKKISKEDEEFLKKLSPSIKRKENMLCYFQKLSKNSDQLQGDSDSESKNNDDPIIKVKLKSKAQLKKKKCKHSKIQTNESAINNPHTCYELSHFPSNNGLNTICNINIEVSKEEIVNDNNDHSVQNPDDIRPKRNTKRPVKYSDDFQLTSSDEELHIFTPKKKRKGRVESPIVFKDSDLEVIEKGCPVVTESYVKSKRTKVIEVKKKRKINDGGTMADSPKAKSKQIVVPKKATKLAPIFVTKPQLDAAALDAKQKFLQSGVPIQLKKMSVQQTSTLATNEFQTVVHVQNLCYASKQLNSHINILNIFDANYTEDVPLLMAHDNLFKKLLHIPILEERNIPQFQNNIDCILQDIKKSYPKFPVYRTYHLLRGKSKGEFKDCIYPDLDNSVEIFNDINNIDINNIHPDKLNWTDKYKPTTEKQVIGNFESIKELRRWLVTWTENNAKSKKDKGDKSDSSDFYHSDMDSRDTVKNENNLLIITGKIGSGKTLSVYAVAAELAIKVIEVNASTKRTGKIMLQDLQEATQSHKVDRGKSSTECSQKLQETSNNSQVLKVKKRRGRKKKVKDNSETKAVDAKKGSTEIPVSQENVRTGMSLILIDDADIVFDQDDGFCYAISQLIQSSKRPVILVTSTLSCPHLQKFLQMAKIIKMRQFLPRMLGTWIDIMCLVDNNMCSPGLGAKILDLFNGDIRKAINYLQFYMTSQKHIMCNDRGSGMSQGEDILKVNIDDENSCMSWADNEGFDDKNTVILNSNDTTSNYFVSKELQLLQSSSASYNYHIWWNLPDIMKGSNEEAVGKPEKSDKHIEIKNLNTIADVLDTISLTDYWGGQSNLNEDFNIHSRPWHSYESDSVIDSENFASYNRSNDYINEISCEFVASSIAVAQKVFKNENKTEIKHPSLSIQREREKLVSHHNILTNSLHPSAALDRRALALDYWSSCRSICRIVKTQTDTKSKRNNRFCHYLKSINVLCKNDYYDNLGKSLCFQNKTENILYKN